MVFDETRNWPVLSYQLRLALVVTDSRFDSPIPFGTRFSPCCRSSRNPHTCEIPFRMGAGSRSVVIIGHGGEQHPDDRQPGDHCPGDSSSGDSNMDDTNYCAELHFSRLRITLTG